MQRERIPLNHYSIQAGRIGHLQTLSRIPVLAGDSLQVRSRNIMRLSALRRNLTTDATVDYLAFYVPHRHIYGDDWEDMIKEGIASVRVMPSLAIGSGSFYMGQTMDALSGSWAKDIFAGYNRIWNRYFRFPKLTPEIDDLYTGTGVPTGHTALNSPLTGSINQRTYGFNCARLKTPWTTGIIPTLVPADREVPSASVLDIVDLERTKNYYKTKVDREWKAIRYNDVLKNVFGSGVNIDADERPEMIWRKTVDLSGYDINGTGDVSLGTFAGKSIASHDFGFPRKFMPEHGTVWIMCLVRFPTIGSREINPTTNSAQTYKVLAGDARVVESEPPVANNLDVWMSSPAAATPIGTIPYGQEFRHMPNNINYLYEALNGYPFLIPSRFNTHVKAVYVGELDYDTVFQSQQLGHWQTQSTIMATVFRNYPSAGKSLYAGV